MKFRWKLMLSYMLLIGVISGFFYYNSDRQTQRYFLGEIRDNLISQTRLARLLVENDGRQLTPQTLAEKVGSEIKARVTLIDADGRVVGDSDVKESRISSLENHLNRIEVHDAFSRGVGSTTRYSETLKTTMLYTAMSYSNAHGKGVVRLALPLESLEAATVSLHRMTGGVVGVAFVVAALFSMLLSKLTARPLHEMALAAAQIGKQKSFSRIPVKSADEVGTLATVLNDMAERIDEQMQSLDSEKSRLDTILRGMGEGVMVAGADGTISLVNPAFRTMFSIEAAIEGKRLIEISRNPELQLAFQELDASGGELLREININPGGVTLLTHWVPLTIDGRNKGVVAVFHDITDMKRVENMRRDFVANVSHELRTPVSVIKGYAETLMQDGVIESDPERSQRFVGIIHNHAERLTTLINDILTLSCLESKSMALELNPLDIGSTINKSCMLLSDLAADKHIKLVNDLPAGLSRVQADQGRIEQVMVNLIDNAIKYTVDGGTVRISAEQQGGMLRVSVSDTGIGIPEKDLPRIFERFYRVDEGRSRDMGGTGLGLAIVKHIVQLHGGDISVTSKSGEGSTFSFTLRMV